MIGSKWVSEPMKCDQIASTMASVLQQDPETLRKQLQDLQRQRSEVDSRLRELHPRRPVGGVTGQGRGPPQHGSDRGGSSDFYTNRRRGGDQNDDRRGGFDSNNRPRNSLRRGGVGEHDDRDRPMGSGGWRGGGDDRTRRNSWRDDRNGRDGEWGGRVGRHERNVREREEDRDECNQAPKKRRLLSVVATTSSAGTEDRRSPERAEGSGADQKEETEGGKDGEERDEEAMEEESEVAERKVAVRSVVGGVRGGGGREAVSRPSRPVARTGLTGTDKQRSVRMFGALMGHLGKARVRLQQDKPLLEKQTEVAAGVGIKEEQEKHRLRDLARKVSWEAKEKELSERDAITLQQRQTQLALASAAAREHMKRLEPFLVTATEPKLYFLPATHSPKTQELLAARQVSVAQQLEQRVKADEAELQNMQQEMEEQQKERKKFREERREQALARKAAGDTDEVATGGGAVENEEQEGTDGRQGDDKGEGEDMNVEKEVGKEAGGGKKEGDEEEGDMEDVLGDRDDEEE